MQFTTQVVRHGCYVTAKFIYDNISLDDPYEHEPTFIHQPMKIKLLKRGAAVPLNTAKLNITNC